MAGLFREDRFLTLCYEEYSICIKSYHNVLLGVMGNKFQAESNNIDRIVSLCFCWFWKRLTDWLSSDEYGECKKNPKNKKKT